MKTIYKMSLEVTDRQVLQIPKLKGTKNVKDQILKIDVQRDVSVLWCMVDSEAEMQKVEILCHGTGHKVDEETLPTDYLGTVQLMNGCLVFHFFLGEVK